MDPWPCETGDCYADAHGGCDQPCPLNTEQALDDCELQIFAATGDMEVAEEAGKLIRLLWGVGML